MGDRYAVGLTQTAVSSLNFDNAAGPDDACGELIAVATVRPRIYDLLFGHGGTPADNSVRWEVARLTTVSTGAAAVENALDPASPVADVTSTEEITAAGGTPVANSQLLDFDLNQRATFRWVAAPGGEIMIAATVGNTLICNPSSAAYTGSARTTVHWEE